MARSVNVTCDRCGKEINSYDIKISSARIDIWAPGVARSWSGDRLDFCEECYQKFVDFMGDGD